MRNNTYTLVLFMIILDWFYAQALSSLNQICNPDDKRALEDFNNFLESGMNGWNTSDCCSWAGVLCNYSRDFSDKRVVGLELGRMNLKGNFSESLGNLDQLKFLNLSNNMLRGTLPGKVFNLQNLEVLDLSRNQYSGSIPRNINLPSVWFIDLADNSFQGTIDSGICENLTHIRVLNFSKNSYSGNFPVGFANCSSLHHLSISLNHYLSGTLPDDLYQLQNLRSLKLHDNSLMGQLSDKIGNLSNIVHLDISYNNFTGSLPDAFATLGKLESFSGSSNKFGGHIPKSLSNSWSLKSLMLGRNFLSGPIDLNCTSMVHLNMIDLGSNMFHGPIPSSLSLCQELKSINLAKNNLNSQIPESFKNLQSLSELSLSNTSLYNLSNALTVLQQCSNLKLLAFTNNFHGEVLPSDNNLRFKSLKVLIIANCRLTGTIPQWLSSSTELQLLDLSWNQLGGAISDFFDKLRYLVYINLSNNSLSGNIPKSLTKLNSLIYGHTPTFAEFSVPLFRSRLQYNQVSSFRPSIFLDINRLTGPIWPEFGHLKKLHDLELASNYLSGPIPHELSSMTSLEVLDLSHNNLSGTIPPSLAKLTFLSKFIIAYNHLVGEVPSGGQFSTFPCTSFEGNMGLEFDCDSYTPSTEAKKSPSLHNEEKESILSNVGLPFGVGTVVGFVGIITTSTLLGWMSTNAWGIRMTNRHRHSPMARG